MMDFVAIDFETSTGKFNSACSVAVVDIRNGQMVNSYSTLIKPPSLEFAIGNMQINNITPDMVVDAPTFADIYPQLRAIMENRMVTAHNANFDMHVMRSCIWQYHLPKIKFNTCCTVQISRKVWPDLTNHKLNTVGNFLKIKFHHHEAFDDARVCAQIPIAAGKAVAVDDIDALLSKIGLKPRPFKC